jgi:hypothetical protein
MMNGRQRLLAMVLLVCRAGLASTQQNDYTKLPTHRNCIPQDPLNCGFTDILFACMNPSSPHPNCRKNGVASESGKAVSFVEPGMALIGNAGRGSTVTLECYASTPAIVSVCRPRMPFNIQKSGALNVDCSPTFFGGTRSLQLKYIADGNTVQLLSRGWLGWYEMKNLAVDLVDGKARVCVGSVGGIVNWTITHLQMDFESQLQEERQESLKRLRQEQERQNQEQKRTADSLERQRSEWNETIRSKSEEMVRERFLVLIAILCLATYLLYLRNPLFTAEQAQDHTNDEMMPLREEPSLSAAPPLVGPRFPGGHHFQGSNFKREYEQCKPPEHQHEVLRAVTEIVYSYCDRQTIADGTRDDFLRRLKAEWGKTNEAKDVLNGPVKISCLLVWTSEEKLDGRIEFCSIFCEVLREDYAASAEQAAVLARGINSNLCVPENARDSSVFRSALMRQPFPKGPAAGGSDGSSEIAVCWRGGGFSDQCRSFFTASKQYRAPMFLATSFNKEKARGFLTAAWANGFSGSKDALVLWKIKLDPQERCHHVNLIQNKDAHVEDECEFLFVPYSVFKVESVTWSPTPQDHTTPHRVTLAAAVDNTACPEDLPLAPWC